MPAPATRRTVLQKVRGRPCFLISLPQLVNIGFQVLFHSPPGVLFTFPSLYLFSIAHWVVFSLGGWSPRLPTRFPVSYGTLDPAKLYLLSPTRLSRSLTGFPKSVRVAFTSLFAVHNPTALVLWFRLFQFRSPLLWESMFLSFPPAT